MTTNIFMLGMPSSGKSTLGRQLAKELNYDFIDFSTSFYLKNNYFIGSQWGYHGKII